MSNVNIGTAAQSLWIGRQITQITGVRINAGNKDNGEEIVYSAGTDGYVIEIDNPFGSQVMAAAILSALKQRGTSYQPYEAGKTILDPAAEIGDTFTVNEVDSIIFSKDTEHSSLMAADVAAPNDEEVNHEFTFETKEKRQYKRERAYTRSQLSIQASAIAARVTREGGNPASFGWHLDADKFTLSTQNTEVMRVNPAGLTVKGTVYATAGEIGGCSIVDGVLKVPTASIDKLEVSKITGSITNGSWGVDFDRGVLTIGTLAVGKITGTITNGEWNINFNTGTLTIGKISADNISAGTINAENINVTNINGANIKNKTIKNSSIADGTIQSGKIGDKQIKRANINDNAVSTDQIASSAVVTGKIADGNVTYDKTGFTGTLDQVGINATDIGALQTEVATIQAGYFDSISTNNIAMGNYYFYVNNGYVRAALIT